MIEKGKKEKSIRDDLDSLFLSQIIISLAIRMILRRSLFIFSEDKNFSNKGISFILNNIKKE
ncbi:MAG: hypothetical protein ACUVQN_04365 [Caldisericia bacterium]